MNDTDTQYFKQIDQTEYYGPVRHVKKKIKQGISKKILWKTLHELGWPALQEPDFVKAAEKLNIQIEELKLIFKYYWYTAGAHGPVTVIDIHYLDLKRKNKIKDQPEIYP